jgi:hypothetical protein
MVTVGRRVLLPSLAPNLVPAVFPVLATNPIQAGEIPSFLLATAAPTERRSPPVTWLDDLEHRLTTYFTKKYPAYDFSPYAQGLDRIRGAVSLRDRWGAKREMGVFLTMLASRAYQDAEKLCMHAKTSRIFTSETTGKNHAGCSKGPSSKAAASDDRRRTLWGTLRI